MVMSNRKNVQEWIKLIEVDWLGQYIKTWIAFNAWYKNNLSPADRFHDRPFIEDMKNDGGKICSKMENLLSGESSDQKSFQSNVANLCQSLSNKAITYKNKRISFHEAEDYQYAQRIDEKKNNVSYKIEIDVHNRTRIVTITNSNGVEILCETIASRNVLGADQLTCLSRAQRQTLDGFLKKSTPIHNLLTSDSDPLEIGAFKFINNTNLIARAIIEILYQLRNALFHGEIVPNSETQEVYQPAYLILKSIIPGA